MGDVEGELLSDPIPRVSWFQRKLAGFILWVFRWKIKGQVPPVRQCIFVAGPHTSYWDLVFALAVAWKFGVKITWAGKASVFRFPMGWFMRWLGGIPIVRDKNLRQVDKLARLFEQHEKLYLVIAPKGTRSKRPHWKTGFYHVARKANVPLVLSYLDFRRRTGCIGPSVPMTDNAVRDMDTIRAFYAGIDGKHPEKNDIIRLENEATIADQFHEEQQAEADLPLQKSA